MLCCMQKWTDVVYILMYDMFFSEINVQHRKNSFFSFDNTLVNVFNTHKYFSNNKYNRDVSLIKIFCSCAYI